MTDPRTNLPRSDRPYDALDPASPELIEAVRARAKRREGNAADLSAYDAAFVMSLDPEVAGALIRTIDRISAPRPSPQPAREPPTMAPARSGTPVEIEMLDCTLGPILLNVSQGHIDLAKAQLADLRRYIPETSAAIDTLAKAMSDIVIHVGDEADAKIKKAEADKTEIQGWMVEVALAVKQVHADGGFVEMKALKAATDLLEKAGFKP
jgi:hypothetical protein